MRERVFATHFPHRCLAPFGALGAVAFTAISIACPGEPKIKVLIRSQGALRSYTKSEAHVESLVFIWDMDAAATITTSAGS
jgi:hypothetical protein